MRTVPIEVDGGEERVSSALGMGWKYCLREKREQKRTSKASIRLEAVAIYHHPPNQ